MATRTPRPRLLQRQQAHEDMLAQAAAEAAAAEKAAKKAAKKDAKKDAD